MNDLGFMIVTLGPFVAAILLFVGVGLYLAHRIKKDGIKYLTQEAVKSDKGRS
jgi:hypothetical protein